MLSVAIFAIILTLVTTAYIRSVVSQQKNALSYDLSTRAFYAAEAGVQDAIRALSQNPALLVDKNTCPPLASGGTVGSSAEYGLGYTCQIITMQPGELKGQVGNHSKNATIRLEPATTETGFLKLIVRWSEKQTDASQQVFYPRATTDKQFSPTTNWYRGGISTQPIHAVLRVNIITHPRTGGFSRSAIKQRAVLLNPTPIPDTSPSFRIDTDTIVPQQENFVSNARCYQSNAAPGDYACEQTILLQNGYNLSTQQLYVRISSIYHPTGFSVSLTRNDNTPINIRNGQALIDVTGKAGDNTFRRVQQAVSLGGYIEDNLPDAALVAGEGICKLFTISTQAAQYQQGCNPLSAN